ncbi:MAG: hypothetical protein AAFP26_06310 [Planctomycetota bacterium]
MPDPSVLPQDPAPIRPTPQAPAQQPAQQPSQPPALRLARAAPPEPPSPLTPEDVRTLERAVLLGAPLRKAERFASLSGWSTLLIGLLALPFSLGSAPVLALSLVLIATGFHELALRKRLARLDPGAPRWLALNQAILGGAIIAYAISKLLADPPALAEAALPAGSSLAAEPQIARVFDQAEQLTTLVHLAIYGALIAGTLLFQGWGVLSYLVRGARVRSLLRTAPPWVVDLRQRGILR